ncbi:selenocysteine lyase/cysteine desulfurase [Nocardioides massiliensis]|uniref:Selenocysteine lyase/cysteine desulfurase n=2 Tax=Nocardioides massiliensis TaxID=1325935 RepID=A0ABT9NLE1_9ACTN|nr:aminotransferase class V-fold PLP-dependent enzyme [Nocardioides massiliensis]MDP9821246.1 selenocysteine lyase/cysteine desulfurase [Nocardioides massiliensis]
MSTGWPYAEEFTPETLYLNTASMGLPPRVTQQALTEAHAAWAAGTAEPPHYDATIAAARAAYAELARVPVEQVAIGHQVAPLVGLVAASVADGAEVLVAEGEFTSVSFPFAAHAGRGVRVVEVPLDELAERVGPDTAWVAVAAVQSADGRIADLDAIQAACSRHGTELLVDLTQSAGWLPVDASRYAVTVGGGYKWLLCPRGTAFLTVRPDLVERLRPLAASWYAGADPWLSIYGLPFRLADDARRFDVSPAWFAWVGTRTSVEFLVGIGDAALHSHALEVAEAFCAAAELEAPGSAILALTADASVPAVLAEHRVVAAQRVGRLRLSFHVHNTVAEVEPLGRALRGHVG